MRLLFSVFALGILAAGTVCAPANAQSCNAPAPDVVTTISLPASPFSVVPVKDGCTIFVSMNSGQNQSAQGHIAVLNRTLGKTTLVCDIPVAGQGGVVGIALSHDGKLLAAANDSGVLLFDVGRLMAGDGKPIAEAKDEAGNNRSAGSVYVAISPDDKQLFVSDEGMTSITVYDLPKLRGGHTQAIGRVPVGEAPVGLIFSPDGRKLYATSEEARAGDAPVTCLPLAGNGKAERQGLLTVVDVAHATRDPEGSVLAKVSGGCDFVRVALSGDGAQAFVTARSEDSLLVFDTSKLISDSGHALIATMIPGKAPVGVAAAGHYIVTADSNRLAPAGRKSEWLSVIDPATYKVVGNVPAGLFPRELSITADGKTLLVTNSNSNSLELIDLPRLTPAFFAQQKPIKDADDAELARIQAALAERMKNHQPAPGAEAVLRHIIESSAAGRPDYDAMDAEVGNAWRLGSIEDSAQLRKLGALRSFAFKSTDHNGVDTFEATFEHAKTNWNISLAPDGKAAVLGFDAVK